MFIELHEAGNIVLPIAAGTKVPVEKGWGDWVEKGQSREMVEDFEIRYPRSKGFGIAILFGNPDGYQALDVDLDDPDVVAALPSSPVLRLGQPGRYGALLFRANPFIKNLNLKRVPRPDLARDVEGKVITQGIEIMAHNRYLLMPPSIHPITHQPYRFTDPNISFEHIKPSDLPMMSLEDLERVKIAYAFFASKHPDSPKSKSDGGGKTGKGGRNDTLKMQACAALFKHKPIEIVAEEIYNFDLWNHETPLFSDPHEPGMRADSEDEARANALKFARNNYRSVIKSTHYKKPEEVRVEDNETHEEVKPDTKAYPEPTGLIKDVRDLIMEFSERKMPNIALGGAVALMAAICSNRYRFDRCWSNMYVLNLAPTGTGKSFPQTIVNMILDDYTGSGLIGYGSYQSSSAFFKNLVKRRVRLDVIDEIAPLFAQMKDGGLWQTAIMDEQCKLWSASSGKYAAPEYAEKTDASTCYNPCISILGSTTIEGLKPVLNRQMVMKGLIPRYAIFKDEGYGPRSKGRLNEELLEKVVGDVKLTLDVKLRFNEVIRKNNLLAGDVYDPIDLQPTDPDAIQEFERIDEDFFNRVETEPELCIKDMLTRGKEMTMKFATHHAAGRKVKSRIINIDDLKWAKQTYEVCLANSREFILETSVDSEWERDVQRFLRLFKPPVKTVTMAVINNKLGGLQPLRVKALIEHLTGANKIKAVTGTHLGKPFNGWTRVD